jgi:UDP-glucose 4-epimerase
MKILVTGGAGYIGSHTCVELLQSGHEVVVIDNLSNSNKISLTRVQEITGHTVGFYHIDLLDRANLDQVFTEHHFDSVIHFAGFKSVAESVADPLAYYHNNVGGSIVLFDLMSRHNVKSLVFSSSATVYGLANSMPLDESCSLSAENPYGRTKIMIEEILRDLHHSDSTWNIIPLRYFNPVGAHASGLIGEDPQGIPNNLLPYISQVAIGKLKQLTVHGNDYATHDGTCIRDYVHVVDLAKGHIAAIEKLTSDPGLAIYNLGTGNGYSVMDLLGSFERANNISVPYTIGPRRPGDIDASYTDPALAMSELGWQAKLGIEDMCRDAWCWQQNNPKGYA